MKNLVYVISDVDASHLVDANIRGIGRDRFNVFAIFLANEKPSLFHSLKADGFNVYYFKCRGKIDVIPLAIKLYKLFGELKPDIVHTHLFHAAIIGLTAAKMRRIPRRVNTRHHASELHRYHPHAVYYDKYINRISTHIVAITEITKKVLVDMEGVAAQKISVVHHGFDLRRFDDALETGSNLKEKYGLADAYPIVGIISRHIHWKGIQYAIPAFQNLLQDFPKAKLVLANAKGDYMPKILDMLSEVDSSRYELIRFERDVFALYRCFDALIHVPISADYEAYGQVYVEALGLGVPSVFTLSGVAHDFIRDGYNALVVPYEKSEEIMEALRKILTDEELRGRLVANGRASVMKMFSIERMIMELERVYDDIAGSGV